MRSTNVIGVLILGLATGAVAALQATDTRSLSAGTVFQVTGDGLGRRPTAWLESAERRIPLRVASLGTDTQQTLKLGGLPRNSAGAYDLRVKPKGQKTPFTLSGFTVEVPEVTAIQPPAGARLSEVTLQGRFFGSKKGKVLVDGRPAKIVSWTDTAVRFRVPDLATPGLVFLDVVNQAGPTPRQTFTVNP